MPPWICIAKSAILLPISVQNDLAIGVKKEAFLSRNGSFVIFDKSIANAVSKHKALEINVKDFIINRLRLTSAWLMIGVLMSLALFKLRPCFLFFANSIDFCVANSLWERPWTATPNLALFIIVNIAIIPLFSWPINQALEFWYSKTAVGEPCNPILCSRDIVLILFFPIKLPVLSGIYLGTKNKEIPLVPFGLSGNLASTRWQIFELKEWSPQLIYIFCPVIL